LKISEQTVMAAKPTSHLPSAGVFAAYWSESRRPFASLAFVAPMLVAYELGVLWLGKSGLRNGAEVWLRQLLSSLGFTHFFLLPILTCGILLGWHHLQRERWSVGWIVLYGMLVESLAFGCGLMLIANAQSSLLFLDSDRDKVSYLIAFFGAGIYEEMLFRLMLVPALAAVCRFAGAARGPSLVFSVVVASLLFAAAHYQLDFAIGSWRFGIQVGDPFTWMSFLFRVIAGVFFTALFVYRGFGVAAGTHALYDILATLA
jgi:membrane protease YdiL (CAAX protease family)